jgi:hypothetical protein
MYTYIYICISELLLSKLVSSEQSAEQLLRKGEVFLQVLVYQALSY